jgi:hypothetical protein
MKCRWVSLVVLAGACNPGYDGLRLDPVEPLPDGTEVSSEEIVIVAGFPVVIRAEIESYKRKQYERGEDELALGVEDDSVLLVDRTDVDWEFVLVGMVPGATCVQVFVGDELMECISARVLAQAE